MNEGIIIAFEVDLQRMVGMPCWNSLAGRGTHAMLDFGQKLLRVPILLDQSLSEEQRMYKGEASLFIEHAVWRIEHSGKIMGSWRDHEASSPDTPNYLAQCVGQVVERVTLMRPGLDLLVQFTGGLALRLFCDQTRPEYDNYTYFIIGNSYTVGAHGELRSERAD